MLRKPGLFFRTLWIVLWTGKKKVIPGENELLHGKDLEEAIRQRQAIEDGKWIVDNLAAISIIVSIVSLILTAVSLFI